MPRKPQPAPQDFLPLALPIFQMLLVLGEGERHGYAMKREILKRSGNSIGIAFYDAQVSACNLLRRAASLLPILQRAHRDPKQLSELRL